MVKRTAKQKYCVTCNHWGGARTTNRIRDIVEFTSESERGKCLGGGMNNQDRKANAVCPKWVKWGALK